MDALTTMRETKIRFGRRFWEIIQEEAANDGCSASQFVREAAIARAFYARYLRGEDRAGEIYDRLIQVLREEGLRD